jgi:chemotaxis signal transduction protein
MRPLPLESAYAVVRGQRTPVVDLRAVMGVSTLGVAPGRFLTVATEGGTFALAVDRVDGIRRLDAAAFAALPPAFDDAALAQVPPALGPVLAAARTVPPAFEVEVRP